MIVTVSRVSGLPVKLSSVEVEVLRSGNINDAIELEKNLRISGRPVQVVNDVKSLDQVAEILDQISRYNQINVKMINGDNMNVSILDGIDRG